MTARVIGLDLSLTATGLADGHTTWLRRSKGHKGDQLHQRAHRLETLAGAILDDIGRPDLVVVEQPAYASTSGHMHDRSGLWWLVIGRLHHDGVPVAEATPQQLKKYATGKGNAGKGLVLDSTARRLPGIDTGADDNRADALWLALMGHDHLGQPLVPLPATHRQVLDAVSWPPGDVDEAPVVTATPSGHPVARARGGAA